MLSGAAVEKLLSGNDVYIKVKRMVCLLDPSGFEIEDGIFAQHSEIFAQHTGK